VRLAEVAASRGMGRPSAVEGAREVGMVEAAARRLADGWNKGGKTKGWWL
jgi:hypothetical protein